MMLRMVARDQPSPVFRDHVPFLGDGIPSRFRISAIALYPRPRR